MYAIRACRLLMRMLQPTKPWARQATRADWAMWSMPFLRDSISLVTNGRLNPNATLGNRVYNNGKFYTLTPDDGWMRLSAMRCARNTT